jgi:hypothetical protein
MGRAHDKRFNNKTKKPKKRSRLALQRRISLKKREVKPNKLGKPPTANFIVSKAEFNYTLKLSQCHRSNCKDSDVQIVESNPSGFIHAKCKVCQFTFSLIGQKSPSEFSTNEALIWGMYLSGSHFEQIKNLFTALELPFPSFYAF